MGSPTTVMNTLKSRNSNIYRIVISLLIFLLGVGATVLYVVTQTTVSFQVPSRFNGTDLFFVDVTCSPFQNEGKDCLKIVEKATNHLGSDIVTYRNSFYCEAGYDLRQRQLPVIDYYYGASALCRDGTYSFSDNRSGTCSWHRGVLQWFY